MFKKFKAERIQMQIRFCCFFEIDNFTFGFKFGIVD